MRGVRGGPVPPWLGLRIPVHLGSRSAGIWAGVPDHLGGRSVGKELEVEVEQIKARRARKDEEHTRLHPGAIGHGPPR